MQLAWRPRSKQCEDANSYELAIAGEDSSLRVLAFDKTYLMSSS